MPSDARLTTLLELLQPPVEAFRASILVTTEEIRHHLVRYAATTPGEHVERVEAEFGAFAAGRIDPTRMAELVAERPALSRDRVDTVQRGLEALNGLAACDADQLIVFELASGGDVVDRVARALAHLGRAFGAARSVALARTGAYNYVRHTRALGSFPFSDWNRTERRAAPPIVVVLNGADLHPSGLDRFLDGTQKIVLLVNGPSTPVPLARLVTPGVFVQQSKEPSELERFLRFAGPGIAAVFDGPAASFTHDPQAGHAPWQRVSVTQYPDAPRKSLAGWSAAQQREEMEQLRALATPPELAAASPEAADRATPADPADRLAAWLLKQAELPA